MPGWLSSLRDFFVEASPLRRFMLGLLIVLPLAALGAAYLWFNPPQYRVLYAQLSDRAGGEVLAALEQLDIPYRLSAADGSIEVPAAQLHSARYRLAARGLPRSDADARTEADRAPSFGASSLQEQQRFQRALEQDLARSIQQLEAVELARVHLALPKVSPFLRDAPSATAAVLVRLRPGTTLGAEQVTTIQTLVAASVPRMQRAEVQVLDPRGVLLGGAAPAPAQSQRLALEQDLARRALAVLTPWVGEGRVHVQVTATLQDSETRQTVERMRSVVVGGETRPAEKTVRTTRVPEGSVQRIQAIVVLDFDASAAEIRRANQMASQALGLVPARGDRLSVYALPAATAAPAPAAETSAATPAAETPLRIPEVQPLEAPAEAVPPWMQSRALQAALAAACVVLVLIVLAGLRARRAPVTEIPIDDFDVVLDGVRNQVLADPRVAADVVKLWMRA
ncbi:MAG: flagellar basal-body MS-ring/collar protein FliF [Gammaproteobacteria bacterium]